MNTEKTNLEAETHALSKGDVSTRSCIGCRSCVVLANKQMKTSYACVQRVWTEILPNMSDLVGKTCERYVSEE